MTSVDIRGDADFRSWASSVRRNPAFKDAVNPAKNGYYESWAKNSIITNIFKAFIGLISNGETERQAQRDHIQTYLTNHLFGNTEEYQLNPLAKYLIDNIFLTYTENSFS